MVSTRTKTAVLERAPIGSTSVLSCLDTNSRRIDYHDVGVFGDSEARRCIGTLPKGTPVEVIGQSMDRRLVEIMTESGLRAWVDSISLNKSPDETPLSQPEPGGSRAEKESVDEPATPPSEAPVSSGLAYRHGDTTLTPSDYLLLRAMSPTPNPYAAVPAFVAAILANEEAGTIQLEAISEDKFFRLLTIDRTWMRRGDAEHPWPAKSLEASMTSTGHVEDVVYRWLGSDSANPEESALERLAENLRSRGILFEKVAERRFLKFFTLRSKTYHVSTPFVSIALGPLGDSGAIGRCKASRPGLYRLLLREVRTAFARRQRTYDSWD